MSVLCTLRVGLLSEDPPRTGRYLLLHCGWCSSPQLFISAEHEGARKRGWHFDANFYDFGPTHWAELPSVGREAPRVDIGAPKHKPLPDAPPIGVSVWRLVIGFSAIAALVIAAVYRGFLS